MSEASQEPAAEPASCPPCRQHMCRPLFEGCSCCQWPGGGTRGWANATLGWLAKGHATLLPPFLSSCLGRSVPLPSSPPHASLGSMGWTGLATPRPEVRDWSLPVWSRHQASSARSGSGMDDDGFKRMFQLLNTNAGHCLGHRQSPSRVVTSRSNHLPLKSLLIVSQPLTGWSNGCSTAPGRRQ